MAGFNRIEIIGNLGGDPEMQYTPSGKAVTKFSVAVNDGYSDQKDVTWFNVVCWNALGERCNQYLAKGRQVFVEGRLKLDEWQTSSSQPRQSLKVIANRVVFLGRVESGSEDSKVESVQDDMVAEGLADVPF